MGKLVFDKVYRILLMHKRNDSDGSEIADSLKSVTSQSRQLKQLCFALEQIVWME
jgi:hypothetical protein